MYSLFRIKHGVHWVNIFKSGKYTEEAFQKCGFLPSLWLVLYKDLREGVEGPISTLRYSSWEVSIKTLFKYSHHPIHMFRKMSQWMCAAWFKYFHISRRQLKTLVYIYIYISTCHTVCICLFMCLYPQLAVSCSR